MTDENDDRKTEAPPVITKSRRANRRTLLGCNTQLERVQQLLRNVGIQYMEANPSAVSDINIVHDSITIMKSAIKGIANSL